MKNGIVSDGHVLYIYVAGHLKVCTHGYSTGKGLLRGDIVSSEKFGSWSCVHLIGQFTKILRKSLLHCSGLNPSFCACKISSLTLSYILNSCVFKQDYSYQSLASNSVFQMLGLQACLTTSYLSSL